MRPQALGPTRRVAAGRRALRSTRASLVLLALLALLAGVGGVRDAVAQEQRVADLTVEGSAVPLRLMGYGLVVGLDGTGDRATARQGGVTVQSVVNLLRRFDLAVPPELLRTNNVAAVLVTAEVSPYLRPGGRFELQVAAMGDARSLRGGVLWTTPLLAGPNGPAFATAQGTLLTDEPPQEAGIRWRRGAASAANRARIPDGGVLEADLPRPTVEAGTRLWLRSPDLATAQQVAAAINAALGDGKATVEDPGAITLALTGSMAERAEAYARIRELRLRPTPRTAITIDARSGLVVAGGEAAVGPAVVRQGALVVVIGGPSDAAPADTTTRPSLRLPVGSSILEVTAALRAVESAPADIAAILIALRAAGALPAEVVVR